MCVDGSCMFGSVVWQCVCICVCMCRLGFCIVCLCVCMVCLGLCIVCIGVSHGFVYSLYGLYMC